ncbi:MAG: D-alanyl-D-alanine carboxypeptidase/D-alanyl-D-alanine-endopeptidase [Gemmataceae bacterium]|nr:D-alanyl-D-alanine carboxypeptidase/D-alanyl-D-alanine-endopeptidase [Gemmataceae bacterium]
MGRSLRVGLGWSVPLVAAAFLFTLPAASPARDRDSLTKQLEQVIDGPEYKHASWGVLVVTADGETVYSRNPDAMLAPASVTKLFTCAAALVALGPDRTFETRVFRRGKLSNGTLHGDLVLVGGGDLTFGGRTDKNGRTVFRDLDHTYAGPTSDADLTDTDPLAGIDALARQVKEAGIDRLDGDVLVDDRLFARASSSGSGPDAVTPIMVNDNVVDVIVKAGEKPGDLATVTTRPASRFYQLDDQVTTVAAGGLTAITVTPTALGQVAIRGQIAAGKTAVRVCPVADPPAFARALFLESLRRHGVRAGVALARPTETNLPAKDWYDDAPKVAAFTSPPLKDVVRVTLKVSHNLYASSLPCLVAASRGKTTAEAGLREGQAVLKELGVDLTAVSFGGGAGGNAADHASARATVDLLRGMAKRPEWPAYKDALPVLGVDGTLATVVKPDSPARGKVFAKTGTLAWTDNVNGRLFLRSKALAGVMTTKAGTPLYFAMIVNNVPNATGQQTGRVLGHLCEILYENGP